MKHIKTLFLLLLILPLSGMAHAGETAAPVVIELFTTQSCVGSPAANALLKQMAGEDAALIILGCYITRPGPENTEDMLARPFCNERHTGYFRSVPLSQVATPTLIVNGQYDIIGPNESLTRAAVKMVRSLGAPGAIHIEKRDGQLVIALPDAPETNKAEIWLFGYEPLQAVTAGDEGAGGYINIVTHLVRLTDWDGRRQSFSYPLADMPASGYAVIAQEENWGPVITAGNLTN